LGGILTDLILLVVGGISLVLAIYSVHWRLAFLGKYLEARATVTRLQWEEHQDEHGVEKMGHPVFRFTDPRSGREVEAVGKIGSHRPSHPVGQEVSVLYDPEHLGEGVLVKPFWSIWWLSIISDLVGCVLTLVGLLAFRAGLTYSLKSHPLQGHTSR